MDDDVDGLIDSADPDCTQQPNCDPSYPDRCIPSPPPDLDCEDIIYRNFQVNSSDPHGFDKDEDGISCETKSDSDSVMICILLWVHQKKMWSNLGALQMWVQFY